MSGMNVKRLYDGSSQNCKNKQELILSALLIQYKYISKYTAKHIFLLSCFFNDTII